MKQASLFLEYVPEKNKILDKIFLEAEDYDDTDVIALTPLACYYLERNDLKYSIPEDYVWPFKSNIDDLKLSIKLAKSSTVKTFAISFLESAGVKANWDMFVKRYKTEANPEKVYYFGNDYELLIEVCRETFDDFEKLD